MSNYKFKIKDYHAIKRADIKINGISVLAGENGCGKSTLLRWLHYVVKVLNEYEEMVYDNASRKAASISYAIDRVLGQFLNIDVALGYEIHKLLRRRFFIDPDLHKIKQNFEKVINILKESSLNGKLEPISDEDFARICDFLKINGAAPEDFDSHDISSIMEYYISDSLKNIETDIKHQTQNRTWDNFNKYLTGILDLEIEGKSIDFDFDISEDNVMLFNDNLFKLPLNLTHSILVKTDRIVGDVSSNHISDDTQSWLYDTHTSDVSNAKTVTRVIEKIIQGKVISEEDKITHDNELKYKRADGLDIYLKAAATGIISFSYILRLLENGWIDDKTLLIIDEPEAHLHPQWIVEYARMLILINKHIGTKIVLASHNPDMVAALHSIATREGVIENTNFYIAEKNMEDINQQFTYDFKDCEQDISPIFNSFNIAFDRISDYGEQN